MTHSYHCPSHAFETMCCSGSLTTPPCSGDVTWYVFLDAVRVEADQILAFLFYIGGGGTLGLNARRQQPVGSRAIRYFL